MRMVHPSVEAAKAPPLYHSLDFPPERLGRVGERRRPPPQPLGPHRLERQFPLCHGALHLAGSPGLERKSLPARCFSPSAQVKARMRSNVQLNELALSLGHWEKPSDFRGIGLRRWLHRSGQAPPGPSAGAGGVVSPVCPVNSVNVHQGHFRINGAYWKRRASAQGLVHDDTALQREGDSLSPSPVSLQCIAS